MFNMVLNFNDNKRNRCYEFESNAIVCSNVELIIRNHSYKSDIRKYIPEIGFNHDGEPILGNGQFKMLPNQPFSINQPDILAQPFNIQTECEPTFKQYMGNFEKIINRHPAIMGKFSMLRAFDIQYRMNQIQQNIFYQNMPLSSWDNRDVKIAKVLGARLGVSGNWNYKHNNYNGAWAKSPTPYSFQFEKNTKVIHVKNNDGIYVYSLQIFFLDNGKYAVLPVSFFQNRYYRNSLRLFIPPDTPYTWMNSEYLQQYPNADIVLTNDVVTALINEPSENHVFLANPGGNDWIDSIDIQSLKGRRVICLIDSYNCAGIQSAVNIAARLNSYGIRPLFALKQKEQQEVHSHETLAAEILDLPSFLRMIKSKKINVPEAIKLNRYGAIDIEEVKISSFIFIENIVESGKFTLVVENANVDRNIFSGRILAALKTKSNMFSNHCYNCTNKVIKGIAFIDNENIRRYVELLTINKAVSYQDDYRLLYEPCFFKQPYDSGVNMFKNILNETSPKAVIIDSGSIWTERGKSIHLLKEAVRMCLSQNIAVIVVCRNKKFIQYLPQHDLLLNIYKHGKERYNHVVEVETFRGNNIEPFEFFQKDNEWISKSFQHERLNNINDWNPNVIKSGIDDSFDDELEDFSKEELLGIRSNR